MLRQKGDIEASTLIRNSLMKRTQEAKKLPFLRDHVKEEIVDVFDHATIFNKNTPHLGLGEQLIQLGHHILLLDYQPTTEMMVIDFAQKISKRLPENVQLHSLKLRETESSFAEWYASDNA